MIKQVFLHLLLSSLAVLPLGAQQSNYLFPVRDGEKALLAGNMGEIRGTHFHAGLDIKAPTGTPIKAVADGYVSLIAVSSYGYGKMMQITHESTQQISHYGHMDAFAGKLADFVRSEQYKAESFDYEYKPKPQEFQVKKGEVIGYVGNTGFSVGPHLHFELRTFDGFALNPSAFPFEELPEDTEPPIINAVAISTLSIDGRVDGMFGTKIFPAKRVAEGEYRIDDVIPVEGLIGFALQTFDVSNKVKYTYAVKQLVLYVDNKPVFAQDIQKIKLENNRAMFAHIDFQLPFRNSQSFQRCYWVDGNPLREIYQANPERGKIRLRDDQVHEIKVVSKDVWGNASVITCRVQRTKLGRKSPDPIWVSPALPQISYEIAENTLLVHLRHPQQQQVLEGYRYFLPMVLPKAYNDEQGTVYLYDLRKGLPDFVRYAGRYLFFDFKGVVMPKHRQTITFSQGLLLFEERSLFDTLYVEATPLDDAIVLGPASLPLFQGLTLLWKRPDLPATHRQQWGLYAADGAFQAGGQWKGDTLVQPLRQLGVYALKRDVAPPTIKLRSKEAKQLVFSIEDKLSGIKSFKATLDGKFILMDYEYKDNTLKTVLPSKEAPPLKGDFELVVRDEAGNHQVFKQRL